MESGFVSADARAVERDRPAVLVDGARARAPRPSRRPTTPRCRLPPRSGGSARPRRRGSSRPCRRGGAREERLLVPPAVGDDADDDHERGDAAGAAGDRADRRPSASASSFSRLDVTLAAAGIGRRLGGAAIAAIICAGVVAGVVAVVAAGSGGRIGGRRLGGQRVGGRRVGGRQFGDEIGGLEGVRRFRAVPNRVDRDLAASMDTLSPKCWGSA